MSTVNDIRCVFIKVIRESVSNIYITVDLHGDNTRKRVVNYLHTAPVLEMMDNISHNHKPFTYYCYCKLVWTESLTYARNDTDKHTHVCMYACMHVLDDDVDSMRYRTYN
jgi:hypothetical protein